MIHRVPLFGVTAMALASVLRVVMQIVTLPLIGRAVGPDAYGQMALISPFVFLAMLLSESGLGACIVRAPSVTKDLEGTVFCFSAAFSIAMILILALFSYPVGILLSDSKLPLLLVSMSSILLLASANIVPAALLLRAERYQWIAISDIVSSFGGLIAVTVGILLGFGVWSLIAQQIIFWICKVAVVAVGSGYRPSFKFRSAIIRDNISFASHLTGSSIVVFLARNLDNVLIGFSLGTGVLGFYALAFQIVLLVPGVLAGAIYYRVFSGASDAHRSGKDARELLLKTLRGALLISAPAVVGIAVTAQLSITLFFGERWLPTVDLLILLSPFGLIQSMMPALEAATIGVGRADTHLKLSLMSSGLTVVAICSGLFLGSNAVAGGVSVAALLGLLLRLRSVRSLYKISRVDLVKAIFSPLLAAFLMGVGVQVLIALLPTWLTAAEALIFAIVFGLLVYLAVMFAFFGKAWSSDIANLRMVLSSSASKKAIH